MKSIKRNNIIKSILFFLAASLFFTWGVFTVKSKIFPYKQLQPIQNSLTFQYITPLNKRQQISSGITEVLGQIDVTNALVFITYGQSNSVNHGQIGYEVMSNVFMVNQGRIFKYQDPALGGTGGQGSVWGMVGDKLIKELNYEAVYFTMTGWGGRSIEELTHKHYFNYFINELKLTKNKLGRVDGILIHQGESNHTDSYGHQDYYETFQKLVEKIKKEGEEDIPIYLSQTSLCADSKSDPILLQKQEQLIKDIEVVLRGPNTDTLSESKYRLPDMCHFSTMGFEKFSDLWVESIKKGREAPGY